MAPRKKPDATDTEPPEEARPDTTATPLIVDDGKLLPPDVVFTAEQLLRWLEGLAIKHKKDKIRETAWKYVQALLEQDGTEGNDVTSRSKRIGSCTCSTMGSDPNLKSITELRDSKGLV